MPSDDDELRESPLSPADDARIRRLLTEARHTEPMPTEVAARLDGVLVGLVDDRRDRAAAHREPRSYEAPVVDLAARRRRTAAGLLVAAAAVVVLGVGISQVLPQGMMGEADTASQEGAGDDALSDGGGASEEELSPAAPSDVEGVRIRSEQFGPDVRKARARVARGDITLYDEDAASDLPLEECVSADVGPGQAVPAVYDGARAVLVLRAPSGDVQVVDLYLCGDTEPRRSITLTVP